MQVHKTPASITLIVLAGCRAVIPGEDQERRQAAIHSAVYSQLFEDRQLSEPAADADILQWLDRLLLVDPMLEKAFFDYLAALEKVPQEASLEQPELNFELTFGTGMPHPIDIGVEQMVPGGDKLALKGKIALDEAQAAFFDYRQLYYTTQADFFKLYADAWAMQEILRIGEQNLSLLQAVEEQTSIQTQAGRGRQDESIRARLETEKADNEIQNQKSGLESLKIALNTKLARAPRAVLEIPKKIAIGELQYSDEELLDIAGQRFYELKMLAAQLQGREDALELARAAAIPDFKFSLGVENLLDPILGAGIRLPVYRERIDAGVREAQARVRSAKAELRQRSYSLSQEVLALLVMYRNLERQIGVFENSLILRAEQSLQAVQTYYSNGAAGYLDLIDTQRGLLDLRMALVKLQAESAKTLAEILIYCAFDLSSFQTEKKP